MNGEGAESHRALCPFLISVMHDWIWVNPVQAYCLRPDERLHVPSNRTTVPCICQTPAHLLCPRYLQSTRRPAAPTAA
jgi:hypothetical protein